MIAVSIYCSVRLLASHALRRRINVDVNVAHVTMGVAMAGMLVPALTTLPTGVWEAVFVGLAGWFSWQSVRFVARHLGRSGGQLRHVSHYLTHLVMACAMLYMYFAAPTGGADNVGGMSMGGATGATANFVGLPLFFLIVLAASAVWHIDSLNLPTSAQPALVDANGAHALIGVGAGAAPRGPLGRAEGSSPSATDGPDGAALEGRPFMAPRLEIACHVAMCVTMSYMLILML